MTSDNKNKKEETSTKSQIFHLVKFLIFAGLAIMFAYYIYDLAVIRPGQQAEEDAYYEAHGCYSSDGGSMYTCPNGAPPPPPN